MASKKLTPGTPSPISGEMRPKYPNGKIGSEVTVIQGKPLPPTKVAHTIYIPSRPARNGAGRGK